MAKKSKKKYLVETSAVPPGLGESTEAHCNHFLDETSDGTLWTSVFIRKEFICRWIFSYIRIACEIDHYGDLSQAMLHLEHEFGRGPKGIVHAVARMLQEKGEIADCHSMAEEFARLAVHDLYRFDRKFAMCASNRSGCKAGGKKLQADFNAIFDSLRDFLLDVENSTGCGLASLLKLGRRGGAGVLLNDANAASTEVVKNLAKLAVRFGDNDAVATCKNCRTIGDAVIALEQPSSWCLLHVDKSFDHLCDATGRDHKRIQSERAADKEARKERVEEKWTGVDSAHRTDLN